MKFPPQISNVNNEVMQCDILPPIKLSQFTIEDLTKTQPFTTVMDKDSWSTVANNQSILIF